VAHRIGDRNRTSLRIAQQRETVDPCRIHDGGDVIDPRVERYVGDVPIGEAGAARVVADQPVLMRKPDEEMAPDRTIPIVFQMVEPIAGLHQGRTVPAERIGQAHSVGRAAIANLLPFVGNRQTIAVDGEGFDRLRDVLEVLRSEVTVAQRQLVLHQIVGLA
jgi:hypothetical protein